jgi:hypothetical protein
MGIVMLQVVADGGFVFGDAAEDATANARLRDQMAAKTEAVKRNGYTSRGLRGSIG